MKRTGKYLGYLLILGLVVWGLLDLGFWLVGLQTLSQYVIIRSNESGGYAVLMLLIIICGAFLLIQHWELIPILKAKFKKWLQ